MEVILPEFRDENDKNIAVIIAIFTILTGIIAPLIAFFALQSSTSVATNAISKALLNFELLMVICIVITMIPIIGWIAAILLVPFVTIAHLVVTIAVTIQVLNNKPVKIWTPIKFIK